LALLALGVGPGDEVIVPDLTFAATANTVVHAGAKPVFVDISEDYWNIDPERIEAAITRNTRTIMPVHLYGHPCDMGPIMDVANKYGLFVVEDCAQALGAKYEERLVGAFGDVGCFSFFSNKVITTGEGGMVITNNRTLYDRMTILRDHGMSRNKRYWHEVAGFNYRMTNLQAAVGLAQLENVNLFLKQRRFVAGVYKAHLKHIPGITLPPEMDWAENIYWLYSVLIEKEVLGLSRDDLMIGLEREGVETRPFFYPLHTQPPYSDAKVDFPTSNRISRQGLSLPSSNGLQVEQIEQVCEVLRKVISHYKIVGDLRQRA
jgi:perosamine synthetase